MNESKQRLSGQRAGVPIKIISRKKIVRFKIKVFLGQATLDFISMSDPGRDKLHQARE